MKLEKFNKFVMFVITRRLNRQRKVWKNQLERSNETKSRVYVDEKGGKEKRVDSNDDIMGEISV